MAARSIPVHGAYIYAITLPPKVWRPKPSNKYIPVEYSDDIDDGVFDYSHHGHTVYRPKKQWSKGARNDVIVYDNSVDNKELDKDLVIGNEVSSHTRAKLRALIVKYWDCFCNRGAKRTILDYEFAIDTGAAPPVCCKKPTYGPHEKPIIMDQIKALLDNGWIRECKGAWGSQIVLAAKPHQEQVSDIKDFVWRLCISYRGLNRVTKIFEYPIPRCDVAVTLFASGSGKMWIITVDAKQGYHQIKVKESDVEKLAFFGPDNRKYAFTVMPFGPVNAPAFYTCMMGNLKSEWDDLFLQSMTKLAHTQATLDGKALTMVNEDIYLDNVKITSGTKSIIDDIIIWSNSVPVIMVYFESVCQVFQKYRVSFRLDKCRFLQDRVEYVGHDLTPLGNCPAKSKFDLISDWPLPITGSSLHSFIGLVVFYHKYAPFLEIRLKPFRAMIRKYFRKTIPPLAWTQNLIQLFHEIKLCITSSPVLSRYNPDKPTFIKTDWSAEGMGWILMQPADDEQSIAASMTLSSGGKCLFELSKNGARLQPIAFGSRACTGLERKFHSFVGEAACGRWAISQNRMYLWGSHFYWMCDCAAVKEILDYDGNISMVCRWAQELLGYHFTVLHRSKHMMRDVDALTRRFGPLIVQHMNTAAVLCHLDRDNRPAAYTDTLTSEGNITKLEPLSNDFVVPILTSATLSTIGSPSVEANTATQAQGDKCLCSVPVMLYDSATISPSVEDSTSVLAYEQDVCQAICEDLCVTWLCINDVGGSFHSWTLTEMTSSMTWVSENIYSSTQLSTIFAMLYPNIQYKIVEDLKSLLTLHPGIWQSQVVGLDSMFVPYLCGSVAEWLLDMISLLSCLSQSSNGFNLATLWIPSAFIPHNLSYFLDKLPSPWQYTTKVYNAAAFGDKVSAQRLCIHLCQHEHWSTVFCIPCSPPLDAGYSPHISHAYNMVLDDCTIPIPNDTFTLSKAAVGSNVLLPKVIATVDDTTTHPIQNSILHPGHPIAEPALVPYGSIFGRRFGVPFQSPDGIWLARPLATLELLLCYSIPRHMLHNPSLIFDQDLVIDKLIIGCIPYQLCAAIATSAHQLHNKFENLSYVNMEGRVVAPCLLQSHSPASLFDWDAAYASDPDTRTMMQCLKAHKPTQVPATVIESVGMGYRQNLKKGLIGLVGNKLMLFKSLVMNTKYVGLIIVPISLRRTLFDHFHASPCGGHMGVYKTLYRLRMRFFWPGMRENIKGMVSRCAHCIAYNAWKTRQSELYFSWPITVPFWVLHVDLWSPGVVTSKNDKNGYLLNCMCDLTQFVVSSPTEDITAVALSELFMSSVVLTFGMCSVVVVDDGSSFKGVFEDMCKALNIHYWCLSRGNHKGNSVERYHRF